MTSAIGRHTGTRQSATRDRTQVNMRTTVLLAVGLTLAVIAWGYLAWLAIDFGTTARAGTNAAWWLLALASLGAMACLFVGLMLLARLAQSLGFTGSDPHTTKPVGGRRRAS